MENLSKSTFLELIKAPAGDKQTAVATTAGSKAKGAAAAASGGGGGGASWLRDDFVQRQAGASRQARWNERTSASTRTTEQFKAGGGALARSIQLVACYPFCEPTRLLNVCIWPVGLVY